MVITYLSLVIALLCGTVSADKQISEWTIAETRVQNAVVQVWSQLTVFDWLYPYRSPDHEQVAGSGYFIDKEGALLTNYHVVRGAKSVYVTVPVMGRVPLPAKIIGVSPVDDIALLKLTAQSKALVEQACGSINALKLANSDLLSKAQAVLALGFPLAHPTLKITAGCVAGRDFHRGQSVLHVTAPISSGNSGGPVIDHKGNVVGMTTASFIGNIHNGPAQNYNIIIPASEIQVILPDLYKGGLVRRLVHGIEYNKTNPHHAKSLGCPLPAGLFVNYVYRGSLEEKAGIMVGDILYEIEVHGISYKIDEFGDVAVSWRAGEKISVAELLVRCCPGDPVAVTLYRKGQKQKINWKFETTQLHSIRRIYPEYEPQEIDYEMFAGLTIMQLRINHLELLLNSPYGPYYKELPLLNRLENRAQGALVIVSILPGSLARLSECFVPGYVLDMVNDRRVTTLKELRDALKLSLNSGEIKITTRDYTSTVFDLKEVLFDEPKLAQAFVYPLTPIVQELIKSLEKKRP